MAALNSWWVDALVGGGLVWVRFGGYGSLMLWWIVYVCFLLHVLMLMILFVNEHSMLFICGSYLLWCVTVRLLLLMVSAIYFCFLQ